MTSTQTMTVTQHERNEWSRFAQAAYSVYRSDIGHRFSVAATRSTMPLAEFDSLQRTYRSWLVFGAFPAAALPTADQLIDAFNGR